MNDRILYTPKEKKYTKKRKSSFNVWIIVGISFCVVLVILSIAAIRLPALHIQHIIVTGLQTIHEKDIQKEISSLLTGTYAAGLISHRFLPATPIRVMGDHIKKKFPLIAEVEIKKEFPNTLIVTVQERIMFGILCNDGVNEDAMVDRPSASIECSYLDTKGIAYDKAPQSVGFLIPNVSTDMPVIARGERVIDPLMMQRLEDLHTKLPSIIHSPIMSYQLRRSTPREVRAVSKAGFSLIINRNDDTDRMFQVLEIVLAKEIGTRRRQLDYIDLRFGNKVFYKFR